MRKKFLAALLTVAMSVSLLTGCGQQTDAGATDVVKENRESSSSTDAAEGVDTSEEVELTMYLVSDKPTDFDEVWEKVNEELKKNINATIDVQFLSWAEYQDKYTLLFSTGEDFDLIYTAKWCYYSQVASQKGFYELTDDFIQTYAPDIAEILPEEAWQQAKVNGNVYMVPNNCVEFSSSCVAVRGDLMDKYGFESLDSLEDLEAFFDCIVENEDTITPLGAQGTALQQLYLELKNDVGPITTLEPLFYYNRADSKDLTISSTVETDMFREYCKKMKELQEKGYWSKDALSTSDTRTDAFMQGKAAAMVWNPSTLATYCEQANQEHPEWKTTIYDVVPEAKRAAKAFIGNGMAINNASKYPERAMMAINELMTNKTIYELAKYGIEGKHWEAVGDDQYIKLEATDNYPVDGIGNWGWNNDNLTRSEVLEEADPVKAKAQEIIDRWAEDPATNPLIAFTFSEDNVASQIAVCNTLISQYINPLSAGLVDDVDVTLDELTQKLKEAGIDEILEEMQKQANEQFQ